MSARTGRRRPVYLRSTRPHALAIEDRTPHTCPHRRNEWHARGQGGGESAASAVFVVPCPLIRRQQGAPSRTSAPHNKTLHRCEHRRSAIPVPYCASSLLRRPAALSYQCHRGRCAGLYENKPCKAGPGTNRWRPKRRTGSSKVTQTTLASASAVTSVSPLATGELISPRRCRARKAHITG